MIIEDLDLSLITAHKTEKASDDSNNLAMTFSVLFDQGFTADQSSSLALSS